MASLTSVPKGAALLLRVQYVAFRVRVELVSQSRLSWCVVDPLCFAYERLERPENYDRAKGSEGRVVWKQESIARGLFDGLQFLAFGRTRIG